MFHPLSRNSTRKPVKQFGMRGPLSHDSKVFSCLHQPRAEEFVPHAIDGDACSEGILWADSPFRESQGDFVAHSAAMAEENVACWPQLARFAPCTLLASAHEHTEEWIFPGNQRQIAACRQVVQLRHRGELFRAGSAGK